jgi:hypothetical protein
MIRSTFRECAAFEGYVTRRQDGAVFFANRMGGHAIPGFPGSTSKRRRHWRFRYEDFRSLRIAD